MPVPIESRPLGRTGLNVAALGFGCGAVGGLMTRGAADEQRQVVRRAWDAGITYFDTAPGYGDGASEENLGRVLSELGIRPVVGTKFRLGPGDDADYGAAIRRAFHASQHRLGATRIALYQCHNHIGATTDLEHGVVDDDAIIGPIASALRDLVARGAIDHFGITALGETAPLHHVVASGAIASAQTYFNAVNPSAGWAGHAGAADQDFGGLIDRAGEHRVGVIGIRSLAAGALTLAPKRHPNASPRRGAMAGSTFEHDESRAQAMATIAREAGLENATELALRFALSKPGVSTVIVGYSTLTHLDDAIRWAERGRLDEATVNSVLNAPR
ncbi:MAG: aldo/keto reductase [Chloroflexota bacterium]|nr:MAG: aldo/keto reductase [Chloroflexota bacterium]